MNCLEQAGARDEVGDPVGRGPRSQGSAAEAYQEGQEADGEQHELGQPMLRGSRPLRPKFEGAVRHMKGDGERKERSWETAPRNSVPPAERGAIRDFPRSRSQEPRGSPLWTGTLTPRASIRYNPPQRCRCGQWRHPLLQHVRSQRVAAVMTHSPDSGSR